MPSPVSSTLTRTPSTSPATNTATEPSPGVWRRALARRLSEHALEVVRGAPRRRRGRIHAGLDPDAPRLGARGDPAHAAVHQAIETHVAQLHGELSPVDARELEEVIDQAGEVAHLVAHGREVLLGGCEPVLDGLEHRLERREGGAQVVAGMSHQLAACVEEPLELPRHAVEGGPELGQLGGAGLGCPCGQVAASERLAGAAHPCHRLEHRARNEECAHQRRRGRRARGGEHGQVVAGVEHQHARRHDGGEREHDGDERERDDAAPQAGDAPGQEREPDADREGGRGHRDCRADHGENR